VAEVERARANARPIGLRIASPDDVHAAIAAVRGTAALKANTADMLAPIGAPARPADRPGAVAPIHPDLASLVPAWGGLRRGALIAAVGARSLLYALIGPAVGGRGYAAIVGMPGVSPTAIVEHGVDLARLALVPHPGPDWPAVVAALVDGMDLVVVAGVAKPSDGIVRSLSARARRTGAILVTTSRWPGCDLTVAARPPTWEGLDGGYGRLRRQTSTVTSTGRGVAAAERAVAVSFPLDHPGRPRDLVAEAQEWTRRRRPATLHAVTGP
jgi:hypothetical protein